MKTLVVIVSIFGAILFGNANGIAIRQPIVVDPIVDPIYYPGPIFPICTTDVKICAADEYLGTGPDGCPKCLPLQIGPVCTMDVKVCTAAQYLGTGPDGCPACLPNCIGRKCLAQITPIKPNIYPAID